MLLTYLLTYLLPTFLSETSDAARRGHWSDTAENCKCLLFPDPAFICHVAAEQLLLISTTVRGVFRGGLAPGPPPFECEKLTSADVTNIIMAVIGLVGLKRAPECIKMHHFEGENAKIYSPLPRLHSRRRLRRLHSNPPPPFHTSKYATDYSGYTVGHKNTPKYLYA